MRILVVEDDPKIAAFIGRGLKGSGFVVDRAADGETAYRRLLGEPYAASVMDVMLPKLDGLSLIERIRREKIGVPVLILSAKRSVDDRVKGLRAGGDDYLTKPFSFSELLARIEALVRRTRGAAQGAAGSALLAVGDLSINIITREVVRSGGKIDLPVKEFVLLEYLARNAGRPVSKAMILENVWNYDFDPQTNVVDVLVCRLRDKIDKPFAEKMIQTIRGVGYVLKGS
ncbi:MAG TPA: response regulator transcription factor [Elusimicrobiota bacterium]|nr:response regulator transcription factor [Elusimicrobiota bacterium]